LASAGPLCPHFYGSLLPALPTPAVPALHVAAPLQRVGVQPSLRRLPVLPRMPVACAPLFRGPHVVARHGGGPLFWPLPGASALPVLWRTGAASLVLQIADDAPPLFVSVLPHAAHSIARTVPATAAAFLRARSARVSLGAQSQPLEMVHSRKWLVFPRWRTQSFRMAMRRLLQRLGVFPRSRTQSFRT